MAIVIALSGFLITLAPTFLVNRENIRELIREALTEERRATATLQR